MGSKPLVVVAIVALVLDSILVLFTAFRDSGTVDQGQKADCAVVTGCGYGGCEDRLQHAIHLYKDAKVQNLIFTGSHTPNNGNTCMRIAREAGVPVTAIVQESFTRNLHDNINWAGKAMIVHNWKTCLISTEPFNMRTSLLFAKEAGITAYASPATESRYYTSLPRRLWYSLLNAQKQVINLRL